MKNSSLHVIYLSIIGLTIGMSYSLFSDYQSVQQSYRSPASVSEEIGHTENVILFKDELLHLPAKVDTGATTSSLHALDIREIKKIQNQKVKTFVKFITLDRDGNEVEFIKEVVKKEYVKSASGTTLRYFIKDTLWIGDKKFEAHINLADRSHMRMKFLIGRDVLDQGLKINTSQAFLLSRTSL